MRQTFRYREGRMVGADGLPMLNQAERAREPQAPYAVSDCQAPLQSMTDGRIYDSKSEMRKEYRRAGVVEVGNDVPKARSQPSHAEKQRAAEKRRAAAARALSKAGFGAA